MQINKEPDQIRWQNDFWNKRFSPGLNGREEKGLYMTTSNDELMHQIIRLGAMARRGHQGHKHGCHGPHGEHGFHGGNDGHEEFPRGSHGHGRGPCHGHGPGHGHGGHHGQGRVLIAISVKEGLSQKDLAYLLGIRPQSLSEILAKLEERGLIARERNVEDGRVVNVFLTDEGRKRAEAVKAMREKNAADMFSVLTDEEKDQLAMLLAKVAAGMEESHDGDNADEDADE